MIEATVSFLTSSAGGRTSPVKSGYRPKVCYQGEEWDAEQTYPDRDTVHPGETVNVRLHFSEPHLVHVGMPFQVREGRRTVGYGVITKIK